MADYVCSTLCSFGLDNGMIKCHGYDFWMEVLSSKFWPSPLPKLHSEHWGRIFLQLSKYHGDSLIVDVIEKSTSSTKLPFISRDVVVPLLELNYKLKPSAGSEEERSLHERCSSSLARSWQTIPSMRMSILSLLCSFPERRESIGSILLDCIQTANSELCPKIFEFGV